MGQAMKLISIVTPTFNEESNVENLVERVRKVMATIPNYAYEHIFIDNHSMDRTVAILKELAGADKRIRIIVNARNFGQVRSGFHGIRQGMGDAVIMIVADLQDPPEMIPELVKQWENGYRVVLAVKPESRESALVALLRRAFYRLIAGISEVPMIKNATGFGLYDRSVMDILRQIDDPYPYLRGLVCDIGAPIATISYVQPRRERGLTKNNFYTLYDLAMLGITSHSKIPIRFATMAGFSLSLISLMVSVGYFVYKLFNWYDFDVGVAPIVIGLFFFASVQLFCIGIIGEYIGSILTQVMKRPLVVEQERVNFGDPEASAKTGFRPT